MRLPYRVATPDEVQRYRRELYPLQDRLFAIAGEYEELALAGGTALARGYLDHRFSEDLDLFTQSHRVDTLANAVVSRALREGLDVEVERRGSTHVRAMVAGEGVRLQIDFANDTPLVEAARRLPLGMKVYGLRDLAANKIGAFEDRAEAKDIIDLYYLTKTVSWRQMFDDAAIKRVPPSYDALQHILAQSVTGEALLTTPLAAEDYEDFLRLLHDEISREVKKKLSVEQARVDTIISDLLWDAPPERRRVDATTVPVLRRRLRHLSLPKRLAVLQSLSDFEYALAHQSPHS